MDTYQRIALAVAVFGVGAGVATRVFDMSPVVKSIVGDGAIALMVSGVGIFVFACLSVEVRRNLHLMSREERQRWCRAEQEIALLTSPEKIGLWMYLENAHEKESRIREELQHRSMEVPNYELFRKLHKTTSFMRLEFGGSEGVRPEWWGIVRELLSRDPVVEKRTVKRWPSLFVGAVVGLAVGIGVMLWLRGNHQEQTEKPTLSTDSRHADRLSATQREHLKGIFASLGHKAVEIRPGKHDRASKGYATELQLVFNDAGWNAQINPSGDGDIIELGDISGIAIVYKPGSDLARKVLDAFVSEGVAATGKPFDGIVSVDVIQILIGSSS